MVNRPCTHKLIIGLSFTVMLISIESGTHQLYRPWRLMMALSPQSVLVSALESVWDREPPTSRTYDSGLLIEQAASWICLRFFFTFPAAHTRDSVKTRWCGADAGRNTVNYAWGGGRPVNPLQLLQLSGTKLPAWMPDFLLTSLAKWENNKFMMSVTRTVCTRAVMMSLEWSCNIYTGWDYFSTSRSTCLLIYKSLSDEWIKCIFTSSHSRDRDNLKT